MRNIVEALLTPNDFVDITLNYSDRSEKIAGVLRAILANGLVIENNNEERFINYGIIADFKKSYKNKIEASAVTFDESIRGESLVSDNKIITKQYELKKNSIVRIQNSYQYNRNYRFDFKFLSESRMGKVIIALSERIDYAIKIRDFDRIRDEDFIALLDFCEADVDTRYSHCLASLCYKINKIDLERKFLRTKSSVKGGKFSQ